MTRRIVADVARAHSVNVWRPGCGGDNDAGRLTRLLSLRPSLHGAGLPYRLIFHPSGAKKNVLDTQAAPVLRCIA